MGRAGPMNSMINISPYTRHRKVLFLISLKNINSWVGFHHHFCSHLNLSFPICPALASAQGLLLHCPSSKLVVLVCVCEGLLLWTFQSTFIRKGSTYPGCPIALECNENLFCPESPWDSSYWLLPDGNSYYTVTSSLVVNSILPCLPDYALTKTLVTLHTLLPGCFSVFSS